MSDIKVESLTCRYGGSVAVDNIDLAVREGEFLSLLGPSGCGKTTTLRCIAGLESPAAGRISIGGQLVAEVEQGFVVPPNKRALGMVFQSYALWPHMSVFANVAYPLKMRSTPRDQIPTKVRKALQLVGMAEFEQRGTSELSGGQQQRVALARALVAEPSVLLLDEPLSNLDSSLRTHMRRELRRIHREIRTTCVYVTHDQLEAATLSDRIVVMRSGRIQQIGTPPEIFSTPANQWVAEFVGYDNFIPATVIGLEGDLLIVQPRNWPERVAAQAPSQCPQAGAGVTLAIRSSALALNRPGSEGRSFQARVVDSMFVGDLTEFVLDAHGSRLIARAPERAPTAGGAIVSVHLPPDQIVVLPAPQ